MCIAWNDLNTSVDWPIKDSVILSEKIKCPLLKQAVINFEYPI